MKWFKWIIVVRVLIPMHEMTYKDVKQYTLGQTGSYWEIVLKDNTTVRVPTAFTIIEEK